jgi:hypothetical protein
MRRKKSKTPVSAWLEYVALKNSSSTKCKLLFCANDYCCNVICLKQNIFKKDNLSVKYSFSQITLSVKFLRGKFYICQTLTELIVVLLGLGA